jgi:hypothetical protein
MFHPGELVATLSLRIGVVIETKIRHLNQYCKVLWADTTELEWVHHNILRLRDN